MDKLLLFNRIQNRKVRKEITQRAQKNENYLFVSVSIAFIAVK